MSKPKRKSQKGNKAPAKAKAKPVMGRPTLYKPEYAEQVFKFCLLGATDEEISDFFGVSVATINNWKREYPDFLASIQRGKLQADAEIAHSLYNRAKGFEVEIEKEVGKGDDKRIVKRKMRVEADVTAVQFWMKNRQPKKWRDTKQMEVGGPGAHARDALDRRDQPLTRPGSTHRGTSGVPRSGQGRPRVGPPSRSPRLPI